MSVAQLRDEMLEAERLLNTEFSFEKAEPCYRRSLQLIESAPQDQRSIEQLLIEMFLTRQISNEPLAYLMHVLRWGRVREVLEADLRRQAAPIVSGVGHAKVLEAFAPDWENREFYKFS